MRVFKQYGTKERLFEMMKNVNKNLIKENFDFNDAEREHLGQQDMEADQQQNPENWDNSEPQADASPKNTNEINGGLDSEIQKLQDEIEYQHDGPVDEFVAISRAVKLAHDHKGNPEAIANALSNVLDGIKANGTIPSNEFA